MEKKTSLKKMVESGMAQMFRRDENVMSEEEKNRRMKDLSEQAKKKKKKKEIIPETESEGY